MRLTRAIGHIEPAPNRTDAVTSALDLLALDPHEALTPTRSAYPARCIDGRPLSPAPDGLAPRVAGATLTTWAVDLLSAGVFRPEPFTSWDAADSSAEDSAGSNGRIAREWAPAWLSMLCADMRVDGLEVSAHSAAHASSRDCGCATLDSLGTVLALIGQDLEGIGEILRAWGIDPADLPPCAIERATRLSLMLPSGADLLGLISAYASEPIPEAVGGHVEVAVLANRFEGTTLDRKSLDAAIGGHAFIIDVWSFGEVADYLSRRAAALGIPTTASHTQLIAVAAAFNAATLLTLSGPSMPMAVLGP